MTKDSKAAACVDSEASCRVGFRRAPLDMGQLVAELRRLAAFYLKLADDVEAKA